MKFPKNILTFSFIFFFFSLSILSQNVPPSITDPEELEATKAERQRVFDSIIDDPTNLENLFNYANLSIFKSIPDSWAINQIFPIVPIHRHLEEPFCKGNFADLTCDSDGKLNNFIDDGKIKSLLNLHKPEEDKDYLIGIFMTGAYQEALGNLHNLFGSTNVVHIDINQDNSYKVRNIIKEDSKSEILQLLDYSSASLVESIRINTESAIDQKKLTIEEARKLMDQIEISLRKSSYLSE